MIVRIVLAVFISGASGICYLAGLTRLMSALLLGFGSLASLFFGILFMVSAEQRQLWFPVYSQGTPWPFFLISAILAAMVILCLVKKSEPIDEEPTEVSQSRIALRSRGPGVFAGDDQGFELSIVRILRGTGGRHSC